MGALFAWGAGTADLAGAPSQALAAGLRAVFLAAAALCVVAAAAVAAAGVTRPRAVQP